MNWETVFGLIDTKLLIVVAACWVIGYVLKKTPKVPDWTIVYIVTVAAVLLACGLLGWNVETLIQGILAGSFAVYGHQLIKQAVKDDGDE
ncbi:phage holin family protein [Escherichia coli]|uniref:phage holin family protein n=1 Tax=Escherichia coli TaxID=562 RepID=UPI001AECBA97|nr:phage holin family protein [Escherichia coli]MBP2898919.1 phage holin family protein [Escherichia coli]